MKQSERACAEDSPNPGSKEGLVLAVKLSRENHFILTPEDPT